MRTAVNLGTQQPASLRNHAGSDDSDADETATAKPAPAPSAQPEASPAVPALSVAKAASTPRLRTRLFAARCVLELPAAVGEDPRHFNALAAQQVRSLYIYHMNHACPCSLLDSSRSP